MSWRTVYGIDEPQITLGPARELHRRIHANPQKPMRARRIVMAFGVENAGENAVKEAERKKFRRWINQIG